MQWELDACAWNRPIGLVCHVHFLRLAFLIGYPYSALIPCSLHFFNVIFTVIERINIYAFTHRRGNGFINWKILVTYSVQGFRRVPLLTLSTCPAAMLRMKSISSCVPSASRVKHLELSTAWISPTAVFIVWWATWGTIYDQRICIERKQYSTGDPFSPLKRSAFDIAFNYISFDSFLVIDGFRAKLSCRLMLCIKHSMCFGISLTVSKALRADSPECSYYIPLSIFKCWQNVTPAEIIWNTVYTGCQSTGGQMKRLCCMCDEHQYD